MPTQNKKPNKLAAKEESCEIISSESYSTRRKFIKTGITLAGGAGFVACSKDDAESEIEKLEVPTPIIIGPTKLSISKIGGSVQGIFDSKESEGAITGYAWVLYTPCLLEPKITIGSEAKISHNFSIPGTYTLELHADNHAGKAVVKHEILVNPPEFPRDKYDLPLILVINESGIMGNKPALYTLDNESLELVRLFGSELIEGRVNWEPSGEKIIFTYDTEINGYPLKPTIVASLNLITGKIQNLSQNPAGKSWQPSCSPNSEWIAFLDDSRAPQYAFDEVVVMKSDGSGKFYLAGSDSDINWSGRSPSWNSNGNKLAYGAMTSSHKIAIVDNIFSGTPVIEKQIPTHVQLEKLYESENFNISRSDFLKYMMAGANGLAWSPDGEWLVYPLYFGLDPNEYWLLVMSRADGTGDIEIITKNFSVGEDFYLPISPTWSYDGKTIYFIAISNSKRSTYKYDLNTKTVEIMLESKVVLNLSLYD